MKVENNKTKRHCQRYNIDADRCFRCTTWILPAPAPARENKSDFENNETE